MQEHKQTFFRRVLLTLSVIPMTGAIYGGLALQPAMAQIEEIVVTARKREESLLEIPFAISAFSGENLEEANLKTFNDVSLFTPGLTYQNAGSNRADRGIPNIVIRGLNLAGFTTSSQAAMFFIDGAPVFGGEVGSFLDVERVEVLRGPQTAYFGRNTFSGAINLITRDPAEEFGGTVSLDFGRYGTNDVQLSLEGPIVSDALSFRLSGRRNEKGGHYVNNFNGRREIGDELAESLVATLVATPGERVKLKFRGEYVDINDGIDPGFRFPGTYSNCDPDGNGTVTWRCGEAPPISEAESLVGSIDAFAADYFNGVNYFTNVIQAFSLFSPTGRPVDSGTSVIVDKMGLAKEVLGSTFQATVDLPGELTFDWISGYNKTYASIVSDENKMPRENFRTGNSDVFLVERMFSNTAHEARVTSGDDQQLRWVAGASLINSANISSCVAGFISTGPRAFTCRPVQTVETVGVFGGVYYDFSDQLTLSASLRFQNDEVNIEAGGFNNDFDDVGGRLALEYSPRDGVMYFINYARGFRPGGFNSIFATLSEDEAARLTANSGASINIDSETLDQFEFGVKGTFLDGRLQGSALAYVGEITDQIIQSSTNFIDDGGVNQLTVVGNNAGVLGLHGVELEGAFALTDTWTIQATAGWNYTEFEQGECVTCVTQGRLPTDQSHIGNRLQEVPEYTASAVATYARPMFDGNYDGFIRGEYIFEGTKYATEANLLETGDRHLFNLRLGIEKDPYRVEAYVTNLFDDDTYYFVSRGTDLDNFSNAWIVGLPDKRAYGIRVALDF